MYLFIKKNIYHIINIKYNSLLPLIRNDNLIMYILHLPTKLTQPRNHELHPALHISSPSPPPPFHISSPSPPPPLHLINHPQIHSHKRIQFFL